MKQKTKRLIEGIKGDLQRLTFAYAMIGASGKEPADKEQLAATANRVKQETRTLADLYLDGDEPAIQEQLATLLQATNETRQQAKKYRLFGNVDFLHEPCINLQKAAEYLAEATADLLQTEPQRQLAGWQLKVQGQLINEGKSLQEIKRVIGLFNKAIAAGYMTEQGESLCWHRSTSLLAYFLLRLWGAELRKKATSESYHLLGAGIPENTLTNLFGAKALRQTAYRLKSEGVPNKKEYQDIEKILGG